MILSCRLLQLICLAICLTMSGVIAKADNAICTYYPSILCTATVPDCGGLDVNKADCPGALGSVVQTSNFITGNTLMQSATTKAGTQVLSKCYQVFGCMWVGGDEGCVNDPSKPKQVYKEPIAPPVDC